MVSDVSHALCLLISLSQVLAAVVGDAGAGSSDQILLNSGTSEDVVDVDGRRWFGDGNGKFRLSSGNSFPARAAFQDPSLPSQVPYMTGRIFTSASTYKFSVSGKTRHYVRLHFYPAPYNGLNPADAYFDVSAAGGELTLLRNFSAYATAEALTQAYIVREFYLPRSTPDGVLLLTFTPSPEKKGSYAFVNGIEVVPAPDMDRAGVTASLVGFSGRTVDVGSSSAMQAMYRLNVGGQYVPPVNDSGLGRAWYDDSPYLFGAAFGVTYAADGNVTVRRPDGALAYAAPLDVYSTARSMGPDPQLNQNYNLTWVFQVDGDFMYVVRLHFCELQMSRVNQRVFTIYVNNQTAEAKADVIGWASSPGVPLYKDYAVYVAGGAGDEELWLALHPSGASKPEYYDAVLNGLEIFKLNDTTGNLAGPNPSPSALLAAAEKEKGEALPPQFGSAGGGGTNVLGGAAGGTAAVGLVFAICIAVYHRKRRVEGADSGGGGSGWLPLYEGNCGNSRSTISGNSCSGASSNLSSLAASLCRHFSIAEINQATKKFDESLVIGVGGFGKVYRGGVDGGATKVAIKRSNPSSEQGVHEFQTEIEMLSKLRHRHLVSLIGYCEENGEMILVYDYMAQGTLREHLYKGGKPSLPWKQRLEICIGAARGLHYLHTGSKYPIIHRDVKTTNILLDDKWVAKVSDFGLSKTGPSNVDQTHVSTVVKGSFGYLDPEYFRRQQLTDKSDVYSFGVVLFEVLCARAALNPSLPKEQVSLADWALHCRRKGTLEDIVDPALKGKVDPGCLDKFAATAEKCLSDHGVDRPTMGDVLWNLEFALQLQETADQGGRPPAAADGENEGAHSGGPTTSEAADNNNTNIPPSGFGTHHLNESCGGGSELSDESDGLNSSAVFSQLIHPTGR